ncbi:CLAVATA3/ESR (CLE)-related protein 46 [Arachis stenosperma]|uniref:CLAVATA3/ESR (CLE)-related protein 46 n=1 Tax=Arachis stenosperma TaxID=217475 RepID=UPI0025AD7435|nr:CLAVATA3/ESR (CLE)-related protein 46 [Arachis stenosperma]
MPKMRRQIAVLILFTLLMMLSDSALNHVTANAQDIQPVQFKLKTLQTIPRSEHITSWGEEKRTRRKHPSGPNPVGNHLPQTKP